MEARLILATGAVLCEWAILGWVAGVRWTTDADAWWPARWALRAAAGSVLLGSALVLSALLGISVVNIPAVLAVALLLAAVVRVVSRLTMPPAARPAPSTLCARERAGWIILAGVLGAILLRGWTSPETGWDAYSHWGLKARAYFLWGTVRDPGTAHAYYPPLVSLLEAWLYAHLGRADINAAKNLWGLLGAAFTVCVAWHARLVLRPTWIAPLVALGVLLGSIELVENFWTGQADLALTAFLTLSTLALYQWVRTSHGGWLVQAVVFGGGAALTKYEGLYRVVVVAVALAGYAVLTRDRWRASLSVAAAYAALSALWSSPWALYRWIYNIPVGGEHISGLQWLAAPAVAAALLDVLRGFRTGGGVLVTFLALVGGWRTAVRAPALFLTLVLVGHAASTFLGFLATESAPDRQVYVVAPRLLLQFAPVGLFLAACCLVEVLRPASTEARAPIPRVPAPGEDILSRHTRTAVR